MIASEVITHYFFNALCQPVNPLLPFLCSKHKKGKKEEYEDECFKEPLAKYNPTDPFTALELQNPSFNMKATKHSPISWFRGTETVKESVGKAHFRRKERKKRF